jgi:hypothetical protein
MSGEFLCFTLSAIPYRGAKADASEPVLESIIPSSPHAGPTLANVMECDDSTRDNVGKETGEIGQDVLVTMRSVDKQKVDGLVPVLRHLSAQSDHRLDVVGDTAPLNIFAEFSKIVALA